MKKIATIHDLVYAILNDKPKTRGSDYLLYYEVLKEVNPEARYLNFGDILMNFNDYGLPKFEGVGRARRKIQAEVPELRPSENITEGRYESFKAVLEYV